MKVTVQKTIQNLHNKTRPYALESLQKHEKKSIKSVGNIETKGYSKYVKRTIIKIKLYIFKFSCKEGKYFLCFLAPWASEMEILKIIMQTSHRKHLANSTYLKFHFFSTTHFLQKQKLIQTWQRVSVYRMSWMFIVHNHGGRTKNHLFSPYFFRVLFCFFMVDVFWVGRYLYYIFWITDKISISPGTINYQIVPGLFNQPPFSIPKDLRQKTAHCPKNINKSSTKMLPQSLKPKNANSHNETRISFRLMSVIIIYLIQTTNNNNRIFSLPWKDKRSGKKENKQINRETNHNRILLSQIY